MSNLATRTISGITVLSGACTSTGDCVQSPNYPSDYGNSQSCEILAPEQPLYFTHFQTATGDSLTINGQQYSGTSGPSQGIITASIIQWSSDVSVVSSGWQMCTAFGVKLGQNQTT